MRRGYRLRLSAGSASALLATLLAAVDLGDRLPGEQDGPGEHRDVSHVPDAVPRVEPRSRGGNPQSYVVFGKRYYTLPHSRGFVERGIASWYGPQVSRQCDIQRRDLRHVRDVGCAQTAADPHLRRSDQPGERSPW